MANEKTLKRPMASFVILSYIIFWVFLASIGACMMLGASENVILILQIISAWSPTFAFIALFRRIYPNIKLKDFVKKQFEQRLKFSVLSLVVIIQVIIFVVTSSLVKSTDNTLTSGIVMLLIIFFNNLIRGSLGEELGWRGYALNEFEKKYSPLISALIVGGIWGFWHTPLWFLSGYTGIILVKYCVIFMIAIISVSIIMTFFYNLNKNLIIPIIIHQLFNYLVVISNGQLYNVLLYNAIFYLIVAIILILINPKKILYK